MRAYKWVAAEWADAFEHGKSYRVGSLESYRNGEKGRADSDEGRMGYRQEEPLIWWPNMPDAERARASVALQRMSHSVPAPDAQVHMAVVGNTFIIDLPPLYIFCASKRRDAPRYGNGDALFEISHFDLFAHRLWKSAHTRFLSPHVVGDVTYVSNFVDPLDSDQSFDPLKKDPAFVDDAEVRIVFSPSSQTPRLAALFLESPKAAKLVRRIK